MSIDGMGQNRLTDHGEARLLLPGLAALRVDLALVDALVRVRHGFDGEVPLGRVRLVDDAKAVVADVHKLSHGQETCVTVPNPGDLKNISFQRHVFKQPIKARERDRDSINNAISFPQTFLVIGRSNELIIPIPVIFKSLTLFSFRKRAVHRNTQGRQYS